MKKLEIVEAPILHLQSSQHIVIILNSALKYDEEIRTELGNQSFIIKEQAFLTLNEEKAKYYVNSIYSRPRPPPLPLPSPEERRTPRSARLNSILKAPVVEKTTDEKDLPDFPIDEMIETREDFVQSIIIGPIVVLVVERQAADMNQVIIELQELIGPLDTSLWTEYSNSLRSKFGTDKKNPGIRCVTKPWILEDEKTFFFKTIHPKRDIKTQISTSIKSKKIDKINLESLLSFLFPPTLQHPNSTGRLFVFSLYGPLDKNLKIRSGEKGNHIVTDLELDIMSERIEREDILAVYSVAGLSSKEEEQVLIQADKFIKNAKHTKYKPEEIKEILENVPRDDDGCMTFYEMQKAIIEARYKRVTQLNMYIESGLDAKITSNFRKNCIRICKDKYEIAPPSMFIKNSTAIGYDDPMFVSKLLHKVAYQISQTEDQNSPQITQNVKLIRKDYFVDTERVLWNNNFCPSKIGSKINKKT